MPILRTTAAIVCYARIKKGPGFLGKYHARNSHEQIVQIALREETRAITQAETRQI